MDRGQGGLSSISWLTSPQSLIVSAGSIEEECGNTSWKGGRETCRNNKSFWSMEKRGGVK